MGIFMTDQEAEADIKLRVAGAQACRRLLRRCRNQQELARLLGTTQAEISRVARTKARASRRVMRDAVRADTALTAAIEQSVGAVIEGRIEAKKRRAPGSANAVSGKEIGRGRKPASVLPHDPGLKEITP